ncbi:MAG: DUF2723 domain-containing protein [Armatimonadota bacterium]
MKNNNSKGLYFKILAGLSFLFPLIIYILTLCPTTYTEDCGEFITGAYTLGVVHPPGYPVYCMLGKLFTFIPVGSIAWRVNFMSAFVSALAAFFLFLLIYRITKKQEISFASSMLFSFSPLLWSQSVVAEVYSLNIFFLSLCLYLLSVWQENKEDKYIYLTSFIYGLSLCNHHLMLLAGPLFVLFVVWNSWEVLKKPKVVFGSIALFILGLLPYLYIPIASKFNPAMDFGNPESLQGFLSHIQRKVYGETGGNAVYYTLAERKLFLKAFLIQFLNQFSIPFIIIGILGIWELIRKNFKFFLLTFFLFIFNGIFLIIVFPQIPPALDKLMEVSVFYSGCYLIFACYIGLGLLFIWNLFAFIINKNKVFEYIIKSLIILLVLIPLLSNYYENNLSKNYYVYDFVKSAIDLTDKDAVLFTEGDSVTFNVIYFQAVERYRTDIKMYDSNGCVSDLGKRFNMGYDTMKEREEEKRELFTKIIDENYGKRPIYFCFLSRSFNLGKDSEYELKPFGIVSRVVKKGETIPEEFNPISKIHIRNLGDNIYKDYRIKQILGYYWEKLGIYYYSINDMHNADYCFEQVLNNRSLGGVYNLAVFFLKNKQYHKAIEYFKTALIIDPYPPELNHNLASVYQAVGEYGFAADNFNLFCEKYKQDKEYVEKVKEHVEKLKVLQSRKKQTER